MKYMNKRNNRIAELVQESDKFGTVYLVYEDGTDTTVTRSTLKRWWKALPEEEDQSVDPPVNTETEISQLAQELASEAAPSPIIKKSNKTENERNADLEAGQKLGGRGKPIDKKAKKTASKIDPELQAGMEELQSIILNWAADNKDEVFTSSANSSLQALKTGGRLYARFTVSKKLVTISIPEAVAELVQQDPSKRINHMFGCVYRFDRAVTKQDKDLIHLLLKTAREYRVTKNNQKILKKEEK